MTKYLIAVFLLLCAPLFLPRQAALLAQCSSYTQVTGTVTDPDGIPYAYGKITATITPSGGGSPTCTGADGLQHPFANPVGPAQLDASGSFTMQLPPNSIITNGGSTWALSVSITGNLPPIGTGPQQFSVSIAIAGSSQSVSAALDAAAPALSNISGGGGSSVPVPNLNVLYLAKKCSPAQANCFVVYDDGQMVTDAHMTAASPDVSSAEANFTQNDAGKTLFTAAECYDAQPTQAYPLATTIASVTDAHDIVMATNATRNTSTGCLVWGTPDDAGFSAADAAYQAATTCDSVEMPAGIMVLVEPHFHTQSTGCNNSFVGTGGNGYGYWISSRFFGQGMSTILAIGQNFDTAACTGGSKSSACFGGITAARFDDFQIYGNWAEPSPASIVQLMSIGELGELDNFHETGFGNQTSNVIGLGVPQTGYAHDVTIDAGGYPTYLYQTASLQARKFISEDGISASQVNNGASLGCYACDFFELPSSAPGSAAIIVNGTVRCTTCYYWDGGGNPTGGYGVAITGTGVYYDVNGLYSFNSGTAENSVTDNGKYYATNTSWTGSSGTTVTTSATGVLFDEGGNSSTGAIASGVTINGDASVTGTAQTAAGITPSTGWGTTGAAGNGVSNVTGNAKSETFTITAAGTPTTNPTVAIVFPVSTIAPSGGFPHTPSGGCVVAQTGGTGAISSVIVGTPTATGVSFTWEGLPLAGSTYIFQVVCSNP